MFLWGSALGLLFGCGVQAQRGKWVWVSNQALDKAMKARFGWPPWQGQRQLFEAHGDAGDTPDKVGKSSPLSWNSGNLLRTGMLPAARTRRGSYSMDFWKACVKVAQSPGCPYTWLKEVAQTLKIPKKERLWTCFKTLHRWG